MITIGRMNILQIAIDKEGGVTRLAEKLGTKQNVISNWRARGVPLAWRSMSSSPCSRPSSRQKPWKLRTAATARATDDAAPQVKAAVARAEAKARAGR